MTTTRKKAAEALALAAPAAVEAEMLPGDAERMVDAVLRAIREPGDVAAKAAAEICVAHSWSGRGEHISASSATDVFAAMIDSIISGEG